MRALLGEAVPSARIAPRAPAARTVRLPFSLSAMRRIHFLQRRFGLNGPARLPARQTSHGTWQRPNLAARQITPQISPTVVFYINL